MRTAKTTKTPADLSDYHRGWVTLGELLDFDWGGKTILRT